MTRFNSSFVKVIICSLLILTFSRNNDTLTISQHNNNRAAEQLTETGVVAYTNDALELLHK